jgi:hypothetical protein
MNEKTRTSLVTETTLNGSRLVEEEDEAVFFGLNEDDDEGVISFWWCIERTKRAQSFVRLNKFLKFCTKCALRYEYSIFSKKLYKLKNTNNTSEASA